MTQQSIYLPGTAAHRPIRLVPDPEERYLGRAGVAPAAAGSGARAAGRAPGAAAFDRRRADAAQ